MVTHGFESNFSSPGTTRYELKSSKTSTDWTPVPQVTTSCFTTFGERFRTYSSWTPMSSPNDSGRGPAIIFITLILFVVQHQC